MFLMGFFSECGKVEKKNIIIVNGRVVNCPVFRLFLHTLIRKLLKKSENDIFDASRSDSYVLLSTFRAKVTGGNILRRFYFLEGKK